MNLQKIYRQIAKENGVSVAEVKRDMQAALRAAYEQPPADGVTAAYQQRVPRKGEVPTPDEMIRFAVRKIQNEK